MKNNNGFIATSLIYSFFLVFLSVLLATLNGYLINDRIMSRYNKGIKETLDKKALIPMIYSPQNCYVEKGGEEKNILDETSCFKIFNRPDDLLVPEKENYICEVYTCSVFENDECTSNGEEITNMNINTWSEGIYSVNCKIRNESIDSRYIYSTKTNIHVVTNLNGGETNAS